MSWCLGAGGFSTGYAPSGACSKQSQARWRCCKRKCILCKTVIMAVQRFDCRKRPERLITERFATKKKLKWSILLWTEEGVVGRPMSVRTPGKTVLSHQPLNCRSSRTFSAVYSHSDLTLQQNTAILIKPLHIKYISALLIHYFACYCVLSVPQGQHFTIPDLPTKRGLNVFGRSGSWGEKWWHLQWIPFVLPLEYHRSWALMQEGIMYTSCSPETTRLFNSYCGRTHSICYTNIWSF